MSKQPKQAIYRLNGNHNISHMFRNIDDLWICFEFES